MHPHLFTKNNVACEDIMHALEECHAQGFLQRAIGLCNDTKAQLSKCLRAERLKHQTQNRQKSADKRRQIRNSWKEVDENS